MTDPKPSLVMLVADDDPDDRLLLQDAMVETDLAADVRFVEDGEQLMDYLHRRGSYADPHCSPRPGLILLDLNMPRKDGREVLSEMAAEPGLRRIPVVVMTTSRAEEDIDRCYGLGANSYITKPGTFSAMVDVARTIARYWFEIVALPEACHVR